MCLFFSAKTYKYPSHPSRGSCFISLGERAVGFAPCHAVRCWGRVSFRARPRAAAIPKATPRQSTQGAASPRRQCTWATAIPIPINPAMTQTAAEIHAAILLALLNGPLLIISLSSCRTPGFTGTGPYPCPVETVVRPCTCAISLSVGRVLSISNFINSAASLTMSGLLNVSE